MVDSDPRKGEIVVDEATGKELVRTAEGELVEQVTRTPAHGVGQLRVGNYGNKGGGRKTDEVKRYFLELAQKAQEEADKRLHPDEVEKMSTQDLAKLLDVFGKYSVGTKTTVSGPDDGPLRHGIMALPPLDNPNDEANRDDS